MATQPMVHPDGYRIRWRVKLDGAWVWQQVVERNEADAQRASDYVTTQWKNKILDTDPLIVGRAYLFGEREARSRVAGVFTFDRSVEEYVTRKARTWSDRTANAVVGALNLHAGPWYERPVTGIGSADLNDMYHRLRDEGLAHNTIMSLMSRVKAVLRLAHANKRTLYDVRAAHDAGELDFTIKPTTDFQREAVSPETFREFLAYADGQAYAMILTAATIGTRLAELCALRVRDVNVSGPRPTITIVGSMNGTLWQGWTKAEHGRAKLKPRPLPITTELAGLLAPLVAGRSPNAPLFPVQSRRKGLTGPVRHWHPTTWRDTVWHPLVTAARAGGVILPEEFVPHCLRHSMATWLAVRMPVNLLQLRMRHADIKMTARYYHDNDEARAREFDAIMDAMGTDGDDSLGVAA